MNAIAHKQGREHLSQRAFDLLCLTMAAVLALHSPHLPLWLSAALAAVLTLRWWQRRRHGGRIPTLLKLTPVLLLPVLVIGYYGTLFGRAPGSALAVGLLVLKLLESEHARDARTGIAFAFFALMSALLFGQGMVATTLVALALLPALATLNALEPDTASDSIRARLWPIVRLLILSLPLALMAFLFVPRLSSPLWGAPGSQQARTGISGRMSPGDISRLLVDDSPAFRVTFDGSPPPPDQRYFRGPVLWWFDGRHWTTGYDPRSAPPRHDVEVMTPRGHGFRYDVQMEPSRRHWVFALDTPASLPDGTYMTRARALRRRKAIDNNYRYHVQSFTRHVLAPSLAPQSRRYALMLPPGYDPKARALAAQWRRQYGDHPQAIVDAALKMFHDDGFRYTLTPAPLGRNSVDDFLFDTREGFCEHYASAFTFLMRAADIPARVVTGYQGGYWNKLGNYLLVRQSDAHAWSEVWIADRGWVRVDPTAAVRPDRVSMGAGAAAGNQVPWDQRGWLQLLRNRWDIVNHWWNDAVIGFDALRQRGLLTPFGIKRADTNDLTVALAAGMSALLAIGLALTLVRRRQHDPLLRSFGLLERRLARVGVSRRRSEGPRHFLRRAARALPKQRAALRALAEDYMLLRYGPKGGDSQRARRFHRNVRNFRPRRVVK